MKIATWNINSVRLRFGLLKRLVETENPDVICLQETKTQDEFFPKVDAAALGYKHQIIRGEKSYNGVAILSRQPITEINHQDWCKKGDCRHLTAKLKNGVILHNFYVPAGGDIPDPKLNQKFAHKLQFLKEMTAHFKAGKPTPSILVGDLNVAPHEHDVWSHKQLLDVVSHTPVETNLLMRLQKTWDWVDTARHFTPMEEKLYSWWSYRAADWKKSNRGRRLDHIWTTPDLQKDLRAIHHLKDVRDWTQPSDHVPVVAEIG
ncbi:MAG: exodeoxyribonuclease III [Dongiaceae bacterium]